MSVADQKKAAKIVALTVLLLLAVVGGVAWQAIRYPESSPGGEPREAKLSVEKGMTLAEIARRLHAGGLIDHPSWFRFYANERGLAQKIRAGQYTLSSKMTPHQLLDRLVEGVPVEEVAVTIPEGKNMVQVAELLDAAGVSNKDEALKAMRDPAFVRSLGVPNGTLEGYLYPDTYRFRPGSPAQKVLAHLVKRSQDVLALLEKQHADGVAMLKKQYQFTSREIVLMASLVEKETAQPAERPRIAGVFLNRLRLPTFVPHRLETDPTIVYGCSVPVKKSAACQKFEGRIRKMHLTDKDNPYNTYTHEGLPPGPISNPGRAALEAVLAPDATPFLYFVSKNDGTHYFSKTRAEHEAAVNKYQRTKSDSGT
ncbi:MAG: Endolytic murein transglycosylase [Myxococcales bacterium]|nr:Endolytic murein transglycosylase [Myxococcales bacterium]